MHNNRPSQAPRQNNAQGRSSGAPQYRNNNVRNGSQNHQAQGSRRPAPAPVQQRHAPAQQPKQENGQQRSNYFNLHVSGVGYLSRPRWVPIKGTKDYFLCCAVNVMHGEKSKVQYSYMDFKVTGDAIRHIDGLIEASENRNNKIIVAFKAGDIIASPYNKKVSDRETGEIYYEPGALIKGRLFDITYVKINDTVIFQAEGKKHDNGNHQYDDGGYQENGDTDEQIPNAQYQDDQQYADQNQPVHQPPAGTRNAPDNAPRNSNRNAANSNQHANQQYHDDQQYASQNSAQRERQPRASGNAHGHTVNQAPAPMEYPDYSEEYVPA
jgi:Protein of unknown function (DUF3577)